MEHKHNDPSSIKAITITVFVVLFFSMCLFQADGKKEMWPFSFFGMYKGLVSRFNVSRVDIEIVTPSGQIISVYDLNVNGYYLHDLFLKIIQTKSPSLQTELAQSLRQDIVPILEKNKIDPDGLVRVRFSLWKEFESSQRSHPDINQVFFERRWKDL